MILTFMLAALAAPLQASQPQDPAPVIRRIASTALLAAQEYAMGFDDGRVVATAEIEEARLFLTEAIRASSALPAEVADQVRRDLQSALALVQSTAPPDSVSLVVQNAVALLAGRYGVDLEEIPEHPPSLARGAALYQLQCARCHGAVGRGDGRDGVGMDPAPAVLSDPAALRDASPLDFYRRTTIGVAGTAMPAFENTLSPEERWAVALYASTLRLPASSGTVPPALGAFATTARMNDAALLDAWGPGATLAQVSAVRSANNGAAETDARGTHRAVFAQVRGLVDSALARAAAGETEAARLAAFDAYLAFERVEREVRVKDASLAGDLEAAFAGFREQAAAGAPEARLREVRRDLLVGLERAERAVGDQLSPLSLFLQSLILLLREGLEAILVIGALIAFLVKTGAGARRRDIHIGVGMALAASVLTAVALETIFLVTPAQQETLEGITLAVAAVMLFYVSYWLLSKIELRRWNQFVGAQVREALGSGSVLALASVAFLAVYREGFETVLFYKALLLTAGAGGIAPVASGFVLGAVGLVVVYFAINRFGVRLPLKPFFAVTGSFLYYMAFVFAGKAVMELQEGGAVGTTLVEWAPRIPMLGIYPTVESLSAQGVLLGLAAVALLWALLGPRPAAVRRAAAPAAAGNGASPAVRKGDRDIVRSLDRIEADVLEIKAEVERLRASLGHREGASATDAASPR